MVDVDRIDHYEPRDFWEPVFGHHGPGGWPACRETPSSIEGEVVFIDDYGNLLTNITADAYLSREGRAGKITVGQQSVTRRVRTYGDAEVGAGKLRAAHIGMAEISIPQIRPLKIYVGHIAAKKFNAARLCIGSHPDRGARGAACRPDLLVAR